MAENMGITKEAVWKAREKNILKEEEIVKTKKANQKLLFLNQSSQRVQDPHLVVRKLLVHLSLKSIHLVKVRGSEDRPAYSSLMMKKIENHMMLSKN